MCRVLLVAPMPHAPLVATLWAEMVTLVAVPGAIRESQEVPEMEEEDNSSTGEGKCQNSECKNSLGGYK